MEERNEGPKVLAVLTDEEVEKYRKYGASLDALQGTIIGLVEEQASIIRKRAMHNEEVQRKYGITVDKWHIVTAAKELREGHV